MATTSVSRGEVWLTDLGMVAKTRPCLVLSVTPSPADRALYTFVPRTTTLHGTQFEIPIPTKFLNVGAFEVQNIGTVARPKLLKKLGVLKPDELFLVEDAVCAWLGIVRPSSPPPPQSQTP